MCVCVCVCVCDVNAERISTVQIPTEPPYKTCKWKYLHIFYASRPACLYAHNELHSSIFHSCKPPHTYLYLDTQITQVQQSFKFNCLLLLFCIHITQNAWWRLFLGGEKGRGFQANFHNASQQRQCSTVQPEPEVVTYLNQRPSLQTLRDFLRWPVRFKLGHNSKAVNHFKIKARLILQ